MADQVPAAMDRRKQTTYPDVAIDVQPGPVPGSLLLLISTLDEVLIFPMGAAYAAELGKKLTAPRVISANGGG